MRLIVCSVDGCLKPAKSKGFCGNHYATNRRNGTPIPLVAKSLKRGACKADGCEHKSSAKGYCSKHYARWVKYGVPNLPPKKPTFVCSVDGCGDTKHKAHGLCRLHYERVKNGRKLELAKTAKIMGAICKIDGCGSRHRSGGYCNKHYLRYVNHGDAQYQKHKIEYGSGKEWHVAPNGYVVRFDPTNPNAGPNGQVYQHRHVMSEMIGRPLRKNENVHHINGDRADNRPENLELWSKGQPAGQRVTDIVEWAISILSDDDVMSAAVKLKPELAVRIEPLRQA
jgi:hypothetical protein